MIPAQDHGGEPRCPDCGSVDPCEHDDICARAKCSPEQCACVLAAAVVAFDRWLTLEGRL